MRWQEQPDPEPARSPRRRAAGAAAALLGLAVVTGVALAPSGPVPEESGTLPGTEQAAEPTARAGLPHTDRSTPPPVVPPPAVPTPAAVEEVTVEQVTEVAVTAPAPPAERVPVVVDLGSACDEPGATAVTAGGVGTICSGGNGNGNGAPRWHRS